MLLFDGLFGGFVGGLVGFLCVFIIAFITGKESLLQYIKPVVTFGGIAGTILWHIFIRSSNTNQANKQKSTDRTTFFDLR